MSRGAIATAETGNPTPGVVLAIANVYPQFKTAADAYLQQRPARRRIRGNESDDVEEMFFNRSSVIPGLLGEWHALWETTIDEAPILNSEVLQFKGGGRNRVLIRNLAISPENPDGGYLWLGDCRIYDGNFLLGTYIATERSVRSKGVLQLVIKNSGREMEGQWAGASFDSDFGRGLVVMTRQPEALEKSMIRFRNSRK